MGRDRWWSVPAAVLIGIPMYSNAAGIIPVVEALLGKGAAVGTVLAFMMSVVALSFPETIILRKVLSMKLIAVFVGVVGIGILTVGYLFNFLLHLIQGISMKDIKVLGTGCSNCKKTTELIETVARERGIAIHLTKVEAMKDIMSYGIMSTPGIVLDGTVVHAGGVPSRAKVEGLLAG